MKEFDNGLYKNKTIYTRHPNIVNGVIKGKKSWGLWVKEWGMGISECNFTKLEVLRNFEEYDIIIPNSFLKELDIRIGKEKIKRYERDFTYYLHIQQNLK